MKEAPPPTFAAVVRMRPKLAAAIKGHAMAKIPTPTLTPPAKVGDRLLLVEWAGASTGRADLVRVEAVEPCWVSRSWCWHREKHDTNLDALSLKVDPGRAVPLIGEP